MSATPEINSSLFFESLLWSGPSCSKGGRIVQLISLILIHWIVIYPMDSAIQLLNNWVLVPIWLSRMWQWNIDPGEVYCPAVLVKTRVCGGFSVLRAHKKNACQLKQLNHQLVLFCNWRSRKPIWCKNVGMPA